MRGPLNFLLADFCNRLPEFLPGRTRRVRVAMPLGDRPRGEGMDDPAEPLAVSAGPSPESRTAAAITLQRFVRSRRMRKEGKGMLALWPSLSKLRGLYLDDRAIKAGAKESEMYTDEMIVRRETLRSDNLVQAALEEFWVSVPRLAVDRLSKSEYMTLARKFYLISMIEEGMADQLDSSGWRTDAEQDFAADAHRKDHLTKSDFFASWFECADLHTKDVSAATYAGWLRHKAHQMTSPFRMQLRLANLLMEAGISVREWRDDSEIMANCSINDARAAPAKKARRHTVDALQMTPNPPSTPFPPGARPLQGKLRRKSVDDGVFSLLQQPAGASATRAPRPRKSSSDDLVSAAQGSLRPVAAKAAMPFNVIARLQWFGAVSVLELQEREGVKQQARQALDDFVANQEKAKRHAAAKAAMKRLGFSKKSGLTPSMSYEKAFKVLDKDGGGSISVSELKAALVKEGSSEASEAEIQSLIDQVDVNGDGELQLEEFETFWKLFQASVEEAAGPKQELPPVQGAMARRRRAGSTDLSDLPAISEMKNLELPANRGAPKSEGSPNSVLAVH